ncbi:MAG: AIR synthase family protein [Candidatus Bathyarchaeota archaeon]|nr:MAG: AIR synthase family protein [Candidatus Bathyarchaeota archaeon]
MVRAHRFPTGKVPSDVLQRLVFGRLGVPSDKLLLGPHIGEDAAVIDLGDRVLVVASDPITGAVGSVGWLAVHVNANDVASTGARPVWFQCVTLLPEGAGEELLDGIMEEMHAACCEVGISLIGGHTETTPGLDRPILIGFMMGEAPSDGYVTTGGARPGDVIILTKGAGIEGTAVLAGDLAHVLQGRMEEEALRSAEAMIKRISVVPEAMKAVELGGVHSLHDPTEGGLLNGVWEMAEAAGVGVVVREEAIPVAEETRLVCQALEADPLKLLGSGSLLIVVEPHRAGRLLSALQDMRVEASLIGEILPLEKGRVLVNRDGSRVPLEAVEQDEVYRLLDQYGAIDNGKNSS